MRHSDIHVRNCIDCCEATSIHRAYLLYTMWYITTGKQCNLTNPMNYKQTINNAVNLAGISSKTYLKTRLTGFILIRLTWFIPLHSSLNTLSSVDCLNTL